jgi:AmmeMemoRadiSam system protein B
MPHAGWLYSGEVAARALNAVAAMRKPDVAVIFGAIHVPHGPRATLFASGAWETPLGLAHVDDRLCTRLHGQTGLLEIDPHAHENEHSIEVEVPFLQHLLPDTRICPIMVPPTDTAATLGAAVGRACKSYGADVIFIASTDLTHYGPIYGFTPHGVGPAGLEWAKNVNDRRMIDAISALRDRDVVEEADRNKNACGAGAIAATIAASKAMGATTGILLEYTNSFEVASTFSPEPARDAVGYAGMVLV